MRIFLDEDSQEKRLVVFLESDGHDVRTVNDYSLSGADDLIILNQAIENNRALMTRNCGDFVKLAEVITKHSGVLLHYPDEDRQMSHEAIVRAIRNIENTIGDISGQVIPLDHWQYRVSQ